MLDFAWKECSEGVLLPPNRIQCAFQTFAPRTPKLTGETEKGIFQTAIILRDGFNLGDIVGLNVLDFMQIASVYFYLTAYELPIQGLITKSLLYKAV